MAALTISGLRKAGARLVRTGGYTDERVVQYGIANNLAPEQIKQLIIGAQAERDANHGKPGKRLHR